MTMFLKKDIEAEKAKMLAELQSIEAKAKDELAALEVKAKGVFDIGSELKVVEEKIVSEVQKIEKWFVTAIKGGAQTAPVVTVEPIVEPTVVEPTANTEQKGE